MGSRPREQNRNRSSSKKERSSPTLLEYALLCGWSILTASSTASSTALVVHAFELSCLVHLGLGCMLSGLVLVGGVVLC
jgi:hypothetical protein